MLCLSRYVDEEVHIHAGADRIRVVVVSVKPDGKVMLGIDAPAHIAVTRPDAVCQEPRKREKP